MDTIDYKDKIMTHLSDATTYVKIASESDPKKSKFNEAIQRKLNNTLKKFKE